MLEVCSAESGETLFHAPREALRDCCPPGRDSLPIVRSWLSRCRFTATHADLASVLHRHGAWDDLHDALTVTLHERALWLASSAYCDDPLRSVVHI